MDDVAELGVRPAITPECKPYWDAAEKGTLLVERCQDCGLHLFPPRGICRRCLSRSTTWVEVEPPAVLHAYTVNHQAWVPGIKPYLIGLAELPEHDGVRLVGLMHGFEDEPKIGDPLTFGFARSKAGIHRLYFSRWDRP
ncbi:Zn-ribbon domain-containing OB-fold protein [Streptomyces sp. NPDC001984]|uniref:Zn-ribbon domain-containing OB-fold protein n=1 Tax=Streptomyces sp. NPDC002619 TaxID=3364655 RepID=UPI0036BBEDCB